MFSQAKSSRSESGEAAAASALDRKETKNDEGSQILDDKEVEAIPVISRLSNSRASEPSVFLFSTIDRPYPSTTKMAEVSAPSSFGISRTAKDVFSGTAGGIAQVLVGQ